MMLGEQGVGHGGPRLQGQDFLQRVMGGPGRAVALLFTRTPLEAVWRVQRRQRAG